MPERFQHIHQAPLVTNDEPEVCPECKTSTSIYSVLRDGGSQLYCAVCRTCRWRNPKWAERMEKLRRGEAPE